MKKSIFCKELKPTTWIIALLCAGILTSIRPAFAQILPVDTNCRREFIGLKNMENKTLNRSAVRSSQMDLLYGTEVATQVFNRLEDLDPDLNLAIQRIAYDHFWSLPGLSIRDKSLITVSALVAMGKDEQIQIHLRGLMHAGLRKAAIRSMVAIIATTNPGDTTSRATGIVEAFLRSQPDEPNESTLDFQSPNNQRDRALMSLAASVALGFKPNLNESMKAVLAANGTVEDIRHVLLHLIVYCGFPASMNGFAVLKDLREKHD